MPDTSNLIPILLLVTIAGAIVTALATPKTNQRTAGPIALVCSLVPLALVLYMLANFPHLGAATPAGIDADWHYNFEYANWLPSLGLKFTMGLDAIGLWLVVLTAIITPISVLASFNYIKER